MKNDNVELISADVKQLKPNQTNLYSTEHELMDRINKLMDEYDGITNVSIIGILELIKCNYMDR